MLTDKITMRKIRYDVFEFIEKSNLISEIERFLENKELFINDLDYPKDLLKRAELDYYDDDLDLLSQKLEKFIEDYNSEESLVHAPIIDYLNEVNSIVLQDPDNKEAITEAEDKVENFVFQLVQVEKLLLDMVTSSFDLYYIGEDNNVYDRDSDEKIFDYNDIVKGDIDPNDIDIGDAVFQYFYKIVTENQKKIVTALDFDDEGFYIKIDGTDLFSDDVKNYIIEEKDYRLNDFLPTEDDLDDELEDNIDDSYDEEFIDEVDDSQSEDGLNDDVVLNEVSENNDLDDDYNVVIDNQKNELYNNAEELNTEDKVKTNISNESAERMNRLRDTLRNTSNKIGR